MKVDPNLPAFPVFSPESGTSYGVDIRTNLAALMMQGIIISGKAAYGTREEVARISAQYADALIAELNK